MNATDHLLIEEALAGDAQAWQKLIARYEGRLLAFVEKRVGRRSEAEDIVQETFIGLMQSLPNFNRSQDLESYLFAIAAHKLTDFWRRHGRSAEAALAADLDLAFEELPAGGCTASSLARRDERRALEAARLGKTLAAWAAQWAREEDFVKLKVVELALVRGWPPRRCAPVLGLEPAAVAAIKHQILARLAARLSGTSP